MSTLAEVLHERLQVDRRSFLRGAALAGGGLTAAALIGCGGNDNSSKNSSSGTTTAAGTQAAARQLDGIDVSGRRIPYNFPEPAGKTPKPGGTLVVGVTWEPSVLDPTKSSAGGTITVPNAVYDRLLGFKRGPTADTYKVELVPELASQWETSPDGLTYTFKLQPGVKWQNVPPLNGRPFKAQDVKLTYERYQKEGVQQSYFTNMKSAEAVDDQTLKITLKSPQPDFIIPLAGRYLTIFPRDLVDSGEIEKKVIGTGPLILKDVQAGTVTLARNPDYWAGKVWVDGMEFRVITDAAAETAAFRASQIDFGYVVGNTAQDLDQLYKSNPQIQAQAGAPVYSTFAISFNLDNPKYQDERIRRAISLTMDRAEIEKVVMQGYGVTLPTIPWNFIFDKQPTPESGLLGKWWKTDRTQAKQLLQAAGQENLALPMIFYNYADVSNSRPNEVLVDQMRQASIQLQAQRLDYTEFNSQWIGRKFPEAADGWQTVGFDADNFFYQHLRSDSPGNRWRINDKQLDDWAVQQRTELNPQARKDIQRKMWDRVLDMAYRIEKPTAIAFMTYQPWLRGYRGTGPLGTTSYYYDWGNQMKDVWLDK